ncbi:MAG: HupE/UreJ family protein [Gammaproteobacteria bacterium]|nr:MAG: HupE/UreJ family protein [Gammaproteobacteria bacterium]
MAPRHPAPELPDHCAFTGAPAGVQTPSARLWEFSCEGRLSADDQIVLRWLRDGAMVSAEWLDGSTGRRLFGNQNGTILVALDELQAGSRSTLDAVGRYTVLGIGHILEGVDHLLFVLGLLLIVSTPTVRVMPLIQTVTAFTVAHSLTLGLATVGFVDFPSRPVEAAIALSIVFLAMEVVRGWQGHESLTHRQPWLVAFGFGLLHGLGFAGALADVGLPEAEIPIALLFFNVGVELGQLLFVAAVLAGRWLLLRLPLTWPAWVAYAPVYLIGVTGAYWMIERVGSMIVPA